MTRGQTQESRECDLHHSTISGQVSLSSELQSNEQNNTGN